MNTTTKSNQEGVQAIRLTKLDAEEVRHKIGVLCDTPDLQEDYGLTQLICNHLYESIPASGDWEVPAWAVECVREEMKDHAKILRAMSHDAHRNRQIGASLALSRQAIRFDKIATP